MNTFFITELEEKILKVLHCRWFNAFIKYHLMFSTPELHVVGSSLVRRPSVKFLSGRCGAHSIHTALQFLFRPGLMMHAGIYPLLPIARYFPRFVEARFDEANRCASAHAHVSYTSVCLLYIELSINRHLCYRSITWDVQQFNWDFQNCALLIF